MALRENDYEDYYGRGNPAKGYDAYEYSVDNKYSENSGLKKAQNFHTEFRNFQNVRPFDDCEKSFPRGKNFSSVSHYTSSVQGGIQSQNSQTGGYLLQSNQKIQFKWFRKQSTDKVLNVEKGSSNQHNRSLYHNKDNPASTDHPTVRYNQSKSCEREFNDKSLVNCIYGNRKRNLTSHDFPPYKFKCSRGNSKSRSPVKEGGGSFSKSLTRCRRSSERSSDRHYRSRSPSSSCSYISSETDRYRLSSQRETKDFFKRDYKCKSYSSAALQSFSKKSEYKSEFYRQTSRSPSYTPTPSFKNSRSSMKYNQRSYHERSKRSHHRSRSPPHSYSRSSSRNSRYSFRTWSRSSSRGSRYSSLSSRSKSSRRGRSRSYSRNRSRNRREWSRSYSRSSSRGRRDRSKSFSSSRCRSVSRTRYRSKSSEIRRSKSRGKNDRSKSPMDKKASSNCTSDTKFCFGTRRSRTRSPSYSRSRRHSGRHKEFRDSESYLSYISSSSSRSSSQSSDGSRERTAVQKERKSRSRSWSYSSTRRQSLRHQRRDSESTLSSVSSRGSSSSQSGSRSTSGHRTPLYKKRKSRSRSFSNSSSRWHSQRNQSRESDSCSSISSTGSTKKSPRRQMTPLQGERKSPLKDTKTGGKIANFPDRMRKRNEAIVRRQFERFEEERTDEMLASVNNLLGQLVGSVTEHSHSEPVSEPISSTVTSESVTISNQDCPKPETEYRTILIKPKSPQEIAQATVTKDGSKFSAKMAENLRIQLTSNEERNVICEKEQTQVAIICNAKKRKHPPEDCNKENVKDHSPIVKKGKRDLIPRVITMKCDQDSRVVIKKQALNSSFKTMENTSGNKNQEQDRDILVSQNSCDHLTTVNDFAAKKYSPSPHTTSGSINDKEIATQVLELEELNKEDTPNLRNSVNIPVTENQNVTEGDCANWTNVIHSVEVSISSTKQLSNTGNLNSSNSMIRVESANHEKDTHKKEDKQTVQDVLKEKNGMAAESLGEGCVAPSNSDFSDLELTSFDEFTDSDEDSSKFSGKSDHLNSGKVSSDISNLLPDPEMKTPLSNGPNVAHKHPILYDELSSVEADKERSHKSSEDRSQNSSEDDDGRKVKTSTPITNSLDNVSSKISITKDYSDAVKKNLFSAISTEKDHTEIHVDNGLNQQTKNNQPKRRDSTEPESKQTKENAIKKQELSARDSKSNGNSQNINMDKNLKSDGNSQNINMDKVYKKCLDQEKNIAGEKKSIQKKFHDSTKAAKSVRSKFTVERSIKKIMKKGKIEGKHTEKVPESLLKKAKTNTLDFKLREVPSSVQEYKKTEANKSHSFAEKNKEKSNIPNNTHSNKNKNCDESMPKLVSRKDKKRDVSTTSVDSSDTESRIKQKKTFFPVKTCADNLLIQKETSSKFTSRNPDIANKTRKEQSTVADNSKNLSTIGKENSATQKTVRQLNKTSPRIRLIEQEDLFMPITPQRRSRSSGSTKSNTSDKSKKPQVAKKNTIPSTSAISVKGPTVKTSKSLLKYETTQVIRTQSKTSQSKKKSIDVDVTVHEKSSSSEMEIDKARIVDTDSSEIGEMEMINKVDGNKKEHGKKMSKESEEHISPLAMRRQSRAVSTEQLKVLEKNEKVRNRMCLELKQVQKRGRKMSKSGNIQKLKHKFHADLHENLSKKHAGRDETKESVVSHTFSTSTKEWTARKFDKAITGKMTNKTDIVAKNILQKVPERKEAYESDTNKGLKTSSKTSTNSDFKSSNDKSETQISDVSLQEYRNLHEDLDLSSDDEKLLPEEQAPTEKSKEQDMNKKTNQDQVMEKLKAGTQKEQDRERHEMEEIQDSKEEERSAGKVKRNCINQDKTSSKDNDSEPMEDAAVENPHQSDKEGEVNTLKLPVSDVEKDVEKVSETSSKKSVCSDHLSNNLSPAKPSTEIPEVQDTFNINSKLCCDQIVPKTNDSIEKNATNTKILKENQSQQAFSSRSRPETPSVNINTVQAARKILPEENSPRQRVVENSQSESQNNEQEADASSDYGTDSNRGTPYSDLTEPIDKVEHQNPVISEKSSVSTVETICSKKRRLIAMTLSEKQSYQQKFMDFLSKLKQEDLENYNSICFLHRKTFKDELIGNGDDNLTIGFLHPLRFRNPKLLCIRCNVCQRYFDPCDFLVHVDMLNVDLNYTSCLLTEPEHAMPSMNQAEQNIWRQFIILKDFLVTAKFNSISLDIEKNEEQRKKTFSSSSQLENLQQQVSQITPDVPRIPPSTAIQLNTAETSISPFIPNNTSPLETRSCVEFVNRRSEHQDTAHSRASLEISRQSCLFQQPSDLMTNTLMLSCSLIDEGLMSFENSSQNEMARRVRRTRSLTDEHLEFQNHQRRYRHQSNTLGDQQTKTNAHFDESVLLAKKLLMMQQRMAVKPNQSNPTKSTHQRFMDQRSYQITHQSSNNQDAFNPFPEEMNQHQLVPRTQPPPYPGPSVHHQTSRLSAPHIYRKETCMFQSNRQAASSQMQPSAMNISPQPNQEPMNLTPLSVAHQNMTPNNISHTTISPAHQNNMFIGGQSSRNAAVYPYPHKNVSESSLHPLIPPDYVNVTANCAPVAHLSSSQAPQANVNMSANPAVPLGYPGPIPQITPVPENLAGYHVPSRHQTAATSNNYIQNQDRSLQSNSTALNYYASESSQQNRNMGRSHLLQHLLQHGNQHQSSVQSCSVNQPSISKDTFILQKEQTLVNHNVPPIQTSRAEPRKLQLKNPEGQLQVGGQFNWTQNSPQTNCENMPSHNASSMGLSSTDPIHLDKSTDTQNQILQLSKNGDKPKKQALDISGGNEKSEYVNKSAERRTSFDLEAANEVAQTISSPGDAQKKMESSCVKMMASLMWMCEEFKRNTAEVISAKQELQQWREEIKKTVDEYHTTEALMTQKIHDVLSKMMT